MSIRLGARLNVGDKGRGILGITLKIIKALRRKLLGKIYEEKRKLGT